MLVQMTKIMAGPGGCHKPGDIIKVDKKEAEALFAARAARPCEQAKPVNVPVSAEADEAPVDKKKAANAAKKAANAVKEAAKAAK
ncbi:MAG: hypothetical protein IID41_14980 [Planctomycetes bacterium]|nr:hypothetical protein [Planctomycetota bacterium]